MAIEYPSTPTSSPMSVTTIDPNVGSPTNILDASQAFEINFNWNVPPPWNALMPGHTFRVRAYVESIGPGPEIQIGGTHTELGHAAQPYSCTFSVAGGTLPGEGELFNGVPVSGVYKIVGVLQHLNGNGTATEISGFAEVNLRLLRTP